MNTFEIVLLIIGIVLFILLCLIILISFILILYYLKPKKFSYEHIIESLKKCNSYDDVKDLKKEEYEIKLRDDYIINASIYKNEQNSNKYIIMVHGFTANQIQSLHYLRIFYDLGYNIITYDSRNHGKNKISICTMGDKESLDLNEIINDTYKRYGDSIYLGVHGVSMGGAVVLMVLKHTQKLKFVISDCPYADLKELSYIQCKKMFHMPNFLVDIAGFIGKVIYKTNCINVKPIDNIKGSKVPLLLLTSLGDTLIDPSHTARIYDAYEGYKKVHYTIDAEHSESVLYDRPSYIKEVSIFLKDIE